MARPFYVEYAVPVSIAFLVGGVVGLVLGIINFTNEDLFSIGGWGYYLIGIAILCLLVGTVLIWGYAKRVRHLKKLLTVKSKKELLGILDDLEYTAWRLPSKFDKLVSVKKKEFELK